MPASEAKKIDFRLTENAVAAEDDGERISIYIDLWPVRSMQEPVARMKQVECVVANLDLYEDGEVRGIEVILSR